MVHGQGSLNKQEIRGISLVDRALEVKLLRFRFTKNVRLTSTRPTFALYVGYDVVDAIFRFQSYFCVFPRVSFRPSKKGNIFMVALVWSKLKLFRIVFR